MNAPIQNPHMMKAGHARRFNPSTPHIKHYVGFVGNYTSFAGHTTRKQFKTATKALGYASRVLIRYRRMYDAAIVEMSKSA